MESDKKIEMIEKAIRKVMEDEEMKGNTSLSHDNVVGEEEGDEKAGRHNQHQLLSKLLSELESFEEDNHGAEESKDAEDTESSEMKNPQKEAGSCSNEEIIKELKNVKRQNSITHHLLTLMIVVTLAWQLSEVSLIFKIKDGIRNPVKSLGGMIKGFFLKGQPQFNIPHVMQQASDNQNQVIEPIHLPGLNLPHWDLPGFYTSNEDDDDDED